MSGVDKKPADEAVHQLRLDFTKARKNHGPDPLLKAIGKHAKTVVDATAGWATDASHLARSGYHVIAIEKNQQVADMLVNALADCNEEWVSRLEIIHADSVEYLPTITPCPDVIYLDPMYPPNRKTAAAKKPLTLLRMLVGPPGDSGPLFEQAMSHAKQRVVVKRPHRAPPLQPGKVGETEGKLVRFDIYKPHTK